MSSSLQLLGVNLMLIMYFLSGIDKVKNFRTTAAGFVKKVPVPVFSAQFGALAIFFAVLIEVIAPLLINYGHLADEKKYAVYGLASLIVFTIVATLIYHFPPKGREYYPFMSNLTAVGGLLTALTIYAR